MPNDRSCVNFRASSLSDLKEIGCGGEARTGQQPAFFHTIGIYLRKKMGARKRPNYPIYFSRETVYS